MRFLFVTLLGIGLILPSLVQARPVSYPGGWTFITMNDGTLNSAYVHYSPTAKISVGYTFEYWRDRELYLNAARVTHLVKRWNKPDSQANLYFKTGFGVAYSDAGELDGETSAAGFAGLAADWEDRRYFISYENRYTEAGGIADFFQQSARVGWAPYEGDFDDLHTWLMLQVKHSPESEGNFTLTPLVRFFKGVHLLEVGMSNRGEVLLNYIFRY